MADEEKEGKGRSKLFIALLVVLPLVMGILVAVAFLMLAGPDTLGNLFHDPVAEEKPSYVEPIDEFQINLADDGANRFLRVQMYIGYENEAVGEEMQRRRPEIRSELIALLRGKTVEDIQQPGGQEELSDDIIALLNGLLVTGEVDTLYFEKFMIQ